MEIHQPTSWDDDTSYVVGPASATDMGVALFNGVTGKLIKNSSNFVQLANGNVGIGTTGPNANALLDISSTTKAFMPPRMTTTQKNAIASPTAGMVVFDSSLAKLCVYTTAWETITSV